MRIIRATVVFIFLPVILLSCAAGRYLVTEPAAPSEITGSYTLLLYGGRYSEDIETVAILDKEGDPYTFGIYSREFNYTVEKSVPAKEAIEKAQKYISFHRSFTNTQTRKIIDREGKVVGYELRPLYNMYEFGSPDVLYTDYLIKDDKVTVYIRLRQEIENDGPFLFKRMRDD